MQRKGQWNCEGGACNEVLLVAAGALPCPLLATALSEQGLSLPGTARHLSASPCTLTGTTARAARGPREVVLALAC